jgi:hypothetical protein
MSCLRLTLDPDPLLTPIGRGGGEPIDRENDARLQRLTLSRVYKTDGKQDGYRQGCLRAHTNRSLKNAMLPGCRDGQIPKQEYAGSSARRDDAR